MRFSKEPIVWIGAIVIILNTIQSALQGESLTPTMINNLIIAVGATTGRKFVVPVAKYTKHTENLSKDLNKFLTKPDPEVGSSN